MESERLFLQFDWLQSLHFFKVSVGTLQSYRRNKLITCDIFQKLPHLHALHLDLPRKWWINKPMQPGPPLFHEVEPCPRTLQRLIYERAAEISAAYKNVHLTGFLQGGAPVHELSRERSARAEISPTEIEELYTDSDGIDGMQLEADD